MHRPNLCGLSDPCSNLIIRDDATEIYYVTCGTVIVATPPPTGTERAVTPYRTVYVILPQTSKSGIPDGQQVTFLNGSFTEHPLEVVFIGVNGHPRIRSLTDLPEDIITMRTISMGPNFTATFHFTGYRWLQSLASTPYRDTAQITTVNQFQLLDLGSTGFYFGIKSFTISPTSIPNATQQKYTLTPPVLFKTAVTSSGQSVNSTIGISPSLTPESSLWYGTAELYLSDNATVPNIPISIVKNPTQYFMAVQITSIKIPITPPPPPPPPAVPTPLVLGCFAQVPRKEILTADCSDYLPLTSLYSAFGANSSGDLTVDITSQATAMQTFPISTAPSTSIYSSPLTLQSSYSAFAILFDGTGAFTNSLNVVSPPYSAEAVLSVSVVFGFATLAVILFETSNYEQILFTLRDYITPQLGAANAAVSPAINYRDFGQFSGQVPSSEDNTAVPNTLAQFRCPGVAENLPFLPCPVSVVSGAYKITIPKYNLLIFSGGVPNVVTPPPNSFSYYNLTPSFPIVPNTVDPLNLLTIPALGSASTPSILTTILDFSTPVLLSGMNKPGTEWCPAGWFLFDDNAQSGASDNLNALWRQLYTMHTSGSATPQPGSMPYTFPQGNGTLSTWSGWCCDTLRIPMNQQFWLESVSIQGVPTVPTFTYSAGKYEQFYQKLIKQIIYLARSVGFKYIILDLHWSDCGDLSASHIQSPSGLSCTTSFGNQNGVLGNIGQQMLPDTNSVAFWISLAQTFNTFDFPDVLFELYNEPFPFQDPNSTATTVNNLPYADNKNKIWDAWLNGPPTGGLPTRPLFTPGTTACNTDKSLYVPVLRGEYAFAIDPTTSAVSFDVTTTGYVGMQDLYNVVHAISPERVCIVGGVQFSYRLDGVVGGVTTSFTQWQYAIKDPNSGFTANAPNVLYNAHPYTSQLNPDTNYADFETAFGMMPDYADMICTEYGNNQGNLIGNPTDACDGTIQGDIQKFIDGGSVQSSGGETVQLTRDGLPYKASYTAWAWQAGYCDFPSVIGTNVFEPDTSNLYDYVAFETGTSVSWSTNPPSNPGVPCMGAANLASLQERAKATITTCTSCAPCTGIPATPGTPG
jgi:hypothetical protein